MQTVEKGDESVCGVMARLEKIPSSRRFRKTSSFFSGLEKLVFDKSAVVRSISAVDVAPSILAVAAAHGMGVRRKSLLC